jgi:hypothetical protein
MLTALPSMARPGGRVPASANDDPPVLTKPIRHSLLSHSMADRNGGKESQLQFSSVGSNSVRSTGRMFNRYVSGAGGTYTHTIGFFVNWFQPDEPTDRPARFTSGGSLIVTGTKGPVRNGLREDTITVVQVFEDGHTFTTGPHKVIVDTRALTALQGLSVEERLSRAPECHCSPETASRLQK